LDDALQWSYGLLDEVSQRVFRRLAVFASDMSLAAAEAVAQDEEVPDALVPIGELVDRSLLLRQTGSTSRYHMLDGIRRHGRHLLAWSDEAQRIRDRFVAYYCSISGEAYSGLQSDRGEWWRSHLDDELDNVREVLSLLHAGEDAAQGLALLGNTWRFYHSRGHLIELDLWLRRFFELPGAEVDSEGLVKGLMARAAVHYWREQPEAAVADYIDAVARARELGDASVLADALYGLATSLIIAGDQEEGVSPLEEARRLYSGLGDLGGVADVVAGEAFAALRTGGLVGAEPDFEHAADLYLQAGRHIQATQSIFAQAAVAIAEGRLDDARALVRSALVRAVELNDVFLQAWGLEYMASVELESGDLEQSAKFVGAAEAARERIGGGWRPETIGLDDAREVLEQRLGGERVRELVEPGRRLEIAEAIELALRE
jgi:non-specific serine/threonine protein kinase